MGFVARPARGSDPHDEDCDYELLSASYRSIGSAPRARNMSTSPRSDEMSALVVGGTSGNGKGIAIALAKRDITVVIAGRSKERADEVLQLLNTHLSLSMALI